uniref:hypothetical protein n=1 Tax=Altererythrobacter segetis TaxID=1104773 RepID=UPI00140E605A|nr:hypothetical protein [Altererythrobacter segetis]
MQYYDYRDWIEWPEADIREYAREITAHLSLTAAEAEHLERQMTQQAGHWPKLVERIGPWKLEVEQEALFRAIGNGDDEVFQQNCRFNKPYRQPKYELEAKWETVGSGLTRKRTTRIIRESPAMKRRRRGEQRRHARNPFTTINPQIRNWAEEAMWASNSYPIDRGRWLIPPGNDAPHEGLVWYSRELLSAYYNARDQAQLGNVEAAMRHAFRAGTLCTELRMRLAHGRTYDKYEAVNLAQRDAAQGRKIVPDDARREAYWRFRREGNKRIEAGRLAANELGLASEGSIRNAFPEGKYPAD